ncbi:MAG TPA: hypothetical protein VFA18_00470 [Gemmataceae bacterium]|nr:hypothetical protein [Gemmataceae bacterium]
MNDLPVWRCLRWGGFCLRGFVLIALIVLVGCQGRGNITGTVNLAGTGKPLKAGTITFVSERGHTVSKSGIRDGRYEIKNFPAGPATVAIESVERPDSAAGGRPAQPNYLTDRKYANAQTSGLSYDVQSGDQSKDFEVPPAPKK